MTNCDNSAFIHSCTLLKSPPSDNDKSVEGFQLQKLLVSNPPKLPETLDLRPYMQPVRNQGGRGTCAAFSAAACKEYQEHIDNPVFKEYISPECIYIRRANAGEGMFGRNVMEILMTGVCREALFPYNDKKQPTEIPQQATKEFEHYRIKSFGQVSTIDGVKQALVESGPLLICLPVYDNGLAEFWKIPSADAKLAGGHAVTIVGYNKKGFILRNSWGSGWNKDGHVIFPYEDFGRQWEIWSSIDEETLYIPPDLKPENRTGCLKLCKR